MAAAILIIGFIGIFFVLMSVRLLFIKDGKFKGTCASQSPFLNKEGGTCGYCGRNIEAGEECGKNDDDENIVNKIVGKFK